MMPFSVLPSSTYLRSVTERCKFASHVPLQAKDVYPWIIEFGVGELASGVVLQVRLFQFE